MTETQKIRLIKVLEKAINVLKGISKPRKKKSKKKL